MIDIFREYDGYDAIIGWFGFLIFLYSLRKANFGSKISPLFDTIEIRREVIKGSKWEYKKSYPLYLKQFVSYFYLSTITTLLILVILLWILSSVYIVGLAGTYALDNSGSIFFIPIFMMVGFILYGFRSKYPFLYGLTEMVVGLSSIWFSSISSGHLSDRLSKVLAISSGVYIVVRGLDNMHKGVPLSLQRMWKILRWYA